MQPLKEGSRAQPVEMTMSLSGPPGLHRITTVATDNLYHYIRGPSTSQHPGQTQEHRSSSGEPKSQVIQRAGSTDHRLSSYDGLVLTHEPRLTNHEVGPPPLDHESMRSVVGSRSLEMSGSKEAGRSSEHPNQGMAPQHPHHLVSHKGYADLHGVALPPEKGSDSILAREAMLLGQSSAPPRPSSSSHVSEQPHLHMQDSRLTSIPMGGVYSYGLQTSYSGSLTAGSVGSVMSPIGAGHRKSSSQTNGSTGPSTNLTPNMSGRGGDILIGAGLRPLHAMETGHGYLPPKHVTLYQDDYGPTPSHYLPELAKSGHGHDLKQAEQKQIVTQHRELVGHLGPDLGDPRYGVSSRGIPKHAIESTGLHKHPHDSSMRMSSIMIEDAKTASYLNTHASASFSKGHEPHPGMSKSVGYPLSESLARSGQASFAPLPHLSSNSGLVPGQLSSAYPISQRHPDTGSAYMDSDQRSLHAQKSMSVIRGPSSHGGEAGWKEVYPGKHQAAATFSSEDLMVHGNIIPRHQDIDLSHRSLQTKGPPSLIQGSISTGQPRVLFDPSSSKTAGPYPEHLMQNSTGDRYSQKDHLSSRPSSVGRSSQFQQGMIIASHEERSLHDQPKKSSTSVGHGSAALDLTKLNSPGAKAGDSPLDLTVKTKKRHALDRDSGEYDRMLSASKKLKPDANNLRPGGLSQKGVHSAADQAGWMSSPSPRSLDKYEHQLLPSPTFSGQNSSGHSQSNKYSYRGDNRAGIDSRLARDRNSAESHISRDMQASIDGRSSLDQHMLPVGSSQNSKVSSSSIIPEMVRHATGANPPMVPLTTQLQKVKEEQAFQMKLQRMCNDGHLVSHTDSKQISYKDMVCSRPVNAMSCSPNEVVVVRHSQQPCDIPQQSHSQQLSSHFAKQDVHQLTQAGHHPHHPQAHGQSNLQHQKLINDQQEIIELGMKDSSDPLQASRGNYGLRGFTLNQVSILQQQHQQQHQQQQQQQQLCVIQQHQFSPKEQHQQVSSYSNAQQILYTKEPQAFSKDQYNYASQQQYLRTHYLSKRSDEMENLYQKQQQQQQFQQLQRKRADYDSYKQAMNSPQNAFAGPQKWSLTAQSRTGVKPVYQHPNPTSDMSVDFRAGKIPSGLPPRSPSHTRMPTSRNYDTSKLGYARTDRVKSLDSHKTSLPQLAGPLPAGGVREESRRALSRRVSYSGSSVFPTGTAAGVADARKTMDVSVMNKISPSGSEKFDSNRKAETTAGKSNLSGVHAKIETVVIDAGPEKLYDSQSNTSSPGLLPPAAPLQDVENGVQRAELDEDPKDALAVSHSPPAQFAMPLSLTIPQTPSPLSASTPSPAGSSSSSTRPPAGCHKAWSRKRMILNAVNQDESLKKIISTPGNSGNKHDSGGISVECKSRIMASSGVASDIKGRTVSSSNCSPIPTSPKMPILSPQDEEGEAGNEEPGIRVQTNNDDPPTLDPSTKPTVHRSLPLTATSGLPSSAPVPVSSSSNLSDAGAAKEIFKSNNGCREVLSNNEEMSGNAIVVRRCTVGNSLPEQQAHLQFDEAQKASMGGAAGGDRGTFQWAEVIRRNTLAGPPWGHMKNVPVANVAPFVHSRDDEDKSKQYKSDDMQLSLQQNVSFLGADSNFHLPAQLPEAPKDMIPKAELPKSTNDSLEESRSKMGLGPIRKEGSLTLKSKKNEAVKRKKLTKLRVSSPTKMKELELISPTLEFAVLKSTGLQDLQSLDKISSSSLKKTLEQRIKYKHNIIREKNHVVKQKKVPKKRIQYVFDDDEDDDYVGPTGMTDVDFGHDDDEQDEDCEARGGNKGTKESSKADAEAKARDRKERALRREQLRDQSEDSSSRLCTSGAAPTRLVKKKGKSSSKPRSRSKESVSSDKETQPTPRHTKPSSRISRRRLSSTNQRAQELKHNALVQKRKTGKRKIRSYNRNAAYEQELHREANRRAVVRAKRQASSKARERLQQQQRHLSSQDEEPEDNPADETWKLPETRVTPNGGKKSNQQPVVRQAGHRGSGKAISAAKSTSSAGSNAGQRKEDYESDVENVPDDLEAEMGGEDGGTSGAKKKKARSSVGKGRGRRDEGDLEGSRGGETPGLEDDLPPEEVPVSLPALNIPVPADVKKLTVNKNSGETLLHRAARIGHEEITLYCLKTHTVPVNARDNAGYTPLHESCVRGSVAVARHLIYHGADVNCCSQDGIRPIHDAIENDHVEVVRLLLVHGADPLIATYAGRTPLRIARSMVMLQTLQGYIADLNGWPEQEDEEEDNEREEDEVLPWRFLSSLAFSGSCQVDKYIPCIDLPNDPLNDSNDVFDDGPTSSINVFNLALDGEDRTPQPFCLLDEVVNRLNMSEDQLTSLFLWKPTSVTLSSERVREVASCCCSNVSIRLPQSGKVTLLPFSSLTQIEEALKLKMKMKLKKEEGTTESKEAVKKFISSSCDVAKKITSSSCVPILTRLEQPHSFLEEESHRSLPDTSIKSGLSSFSFSKQKPKSPGFVSNFSLASSTAPSLSSSTTSSSPPLPLTSTTAPSLVLNMKFSGTSKVTKAQPSLIHSWSPSLTKPQSSKKILPGHTLPGHILPGHSPRQSQHHSIEQQSNFPTQQSQQSERPLAAADVASACSLKPAESTAGGIKEVRCLSSNSAAVSLRKSKKEDSENLWTNTPMFSDDSSSSPFHPGLDCFDSDNSL